MELTTHDPSGWMLTCPVKAWTGVDCPGCGFQRSMWALVQGNLGESWHHYPPLIPFLVTVALLLVAFRTRLRHRMQLLAASVAVTCAFIATHYVCKMFMDH